MPGLRLQLLLLLGGLLVLTFLPLHLALTTYTSVLLRRLDDSHAEAMARVLRVHLSESAADAARLVTDLAHDGTGVVAGSVASPRQAPRRFGQTEIWSALEAAELGSEPRSLHVAGHRLLALDVDTRAGEVRLAINAEQASQRGANLIGIFGLYAFLMASSLLTLAYFALTRLIVRPLDGLSQAAQSVTLGSRQLLVPRTSVRELAELGSSLERMTARLLAKEESLEKQVAEVERAKNDLAKAQVDLVRSERLASVGRLSAGLAHEIGNPIAALIGLADLVLDGGLGAEEQRDFIKRMRAETERINRTLRDLLQFARPAREGAQPAHAAGDVEAAIHDTVALVMHQASLREVELSIDVHPHLPRVTLANEQLSQVLLNLLLNAADAVAGRSGARVSVTATGDENRVALSVEDNGSGVPKEIAGQIFEPFFTTKEVGRGTGLGLSVCQGLVAAAGGSLALDDSCTNGARFVVSLPAARPPSE